MPKLATFSISCICHRERKYNIITHQFQIIKTLVFYFVVVTCDDPGESPTSVRSGSDHVYGSTVTYECVPGLVMKSGHTSIQCQHDGIWTGQKAICDGETLNYYLV